MSRRLIFWSVSAIAFVVVGVLAIPRAIEPPLRRAAVPLDLTARAEIPGIPGARYFVSLDLDRMVNDAVAARERERGPERSPARMASSRPRTCSPFQAAATRARSAPVSFTAGRRLAHVRRSRP